MQTQFGGRALHEHADDCRRVEMGVQVYTAIAVLLSALSSSPYSQGSELKIERMEQMFVTAGDLEIVNKIDDLPPDVIDGLRTAARWEFMADWGERWNPTDMIGSGDLTRQHLFSAVSPNVVAIIFRMGGLGVGTGIIIAERGVDGFCRYDVGDWLPLDTGSVRAAIARASGSKWRCTYHP
jgi:hypothetical protein